MEADRTVSDNRIHCNEVLGSTNVLGANDFVGSRSSAMLPT